MLLHHSRVAVDVAFLINVYAVMFNYCYVSVNAHGGDDVTAVGV